jgi:hypothetical protein
VIEDAVLEEACFVKIRRREHQSRTNTAQKKSWRSPDFIRRSFSAGGLTPKFLNFKL